MKVHNYLTFCTAAALLTFTATATPLKERDLFADGDALITLDSKTGLEWLDITATAGLTYEQVVASQYYTELGFTHASLEQIRTLLADAGVSDFGASFSSKEEMLADPRVRNVFEYFRLTSTTSDQPSVGGDYSILAQQLAQTGENGISSEPDRYHFYGAIFSRVDHHTFEDPWQFDMYINGRLPLAGSPPWEVTQPWTGGHYLVRDARVPELMSTAWLSLTMFGLFLGKRFLSKGTTQS